MSIKVKNLGEFIVQVDNAGNGANGNMSTGFKKTFVIPFNCQLKSIYALSRVAGTTGTQVVDILKNGTSIFSGGTKVNQATTVASSTYGALTTDPTTFVKGDIVTVQCTAVNTTPAVDWSMTLVFQRLAETGAVGATQFDTVGQEAEF